jgi:hypothetical protein
MSEPIENAIEQLSNAVSDVVRTALTVDDFVLKTKAPVEFLSQGGDKDVYGLGLQWRATGTTKQFIYRANPDRYWSSESIDLRDGQSFMIANNPVISQDGLGASVRNSNLSTVGVLQNLRTSGDLNIDGNVFYNSNSERLGVGTDSPSGTIGIASLDNELVIDVEHSVAKIGTYSHNTLIVVAGNQDQIVIDPNGRIDVPNSVLTVQKSIGVGVINPPSDASITAAGPIRYQGKKHEYSEGIPQNGVYTKGDIVWNSSPKPSGNVGWICVRDGTPGEWKPFGQISA